MIPELFCTEVPSVVFQSYTSEEYLSCTDVVSNLIALTLLLAFTLPQIGSKCRVQQATSSHFAILVHKAENAFQSVESSLCHCGQ